MNSSFLNRRLAIGAAVASATIGGVAGAVLAGSASATPVLTASTGSSSTSPAPSSMPGQPGHGRRGLRFGRGAIGTVTGINESAKTLTLRTLRGTLTVTTTSSTKYMREGSSISFSDIQQNDVVTVAGTPSGATSTTTPPTSIAATRIAVQEPRVMGRVQSVSGNTITLVGRDGQLLTVTTSGATKYRNGDGSSATSTAVQPNTYIAAEGSRTGAKSLSADVIVVLPAPGSMHAPARGAPGGATTGA